MRFRIGVLSDTHNYLDPQLRACFEGVDHILHAGDIGMPWVLSELEEIAPLTAVLGNNDDGLDCRGIENVELGGLRFLVSHMVNPAHLTDNWQSQIARENPNVVVFGHTHRPFWKRVENRMFLNPGYAGKPRFGQERSVAILEIASGTVEARFLPLNGIC